MVEKKFNYVQDVCDTISDYIGTEEIQLQRKTANALCEELDQICSYNDSITGILSKSFTMNNWKAEENLAHNWNLLFEIQQEGLIDCDILKYSAEYLDAICREYVLPQAIEKYVAEVLKVTE